MLNRILWSTTLTGLAAFIAVAQTPSPQLQFEVATIKVSAPIVVVNGRAQGGGISGIHGGPGSDQPEQLTIGRRSMRDLLVEAFSVKATQILGPTWLRENLYDITAKVSLGATKDDVGRMLQALLVERMGLTFHSEVRHLAGYELVVGKNGSKLKTPAPPAPAQGGIAKPGAERLGTIDRNGIPQFAAGRPSLVLGQMMNTIDLYLTGREQTAALLASRLDALLDKPVLDKTGLFGEYDFGFAFNPGGLPGLYPTRQPGEPDVYPNLFTAIQQELGLRLEPKTISVEVLVIDKLEKTPTEN